MCLLTKASLAGVCVSGAWGLQRVCVVPSAADRGRSAAALLETFNNEIKRNASNIVTYYNIFCTHRVFWFILTSFSIKFLSQSWIIVVYLHVKWFSLLQLVFIRLYNSNKLSSFSQRIFKISVQMLYFFNVNTIRHKNRHLLVFFTNDFYIKFVDDDDDISKIHVILQIKIKCMSFDEPGFSIKHVCLYSALLY